MKIFRFLTIALVALTLIGCQEAGESTTDLRLHLTSPRFSQRSLIPTSGDLTIDHFVIEADGPKEQSVTITTHDKEVLLGNLSTGWWTIKATAYNSSDTALVYGSTTALLSAKTNRTTVELGTLVGSGALDLTLMWDPGQVADDVRVECILYDQDLKEVAIDPLVVDKKAGSATISSNLAAGSYFVRVRLFSQETAVSGAGEAVRIIDNTTSDGTIDLIIGDLSTAYTLVVVNKSGLPIEGTVSATPDPPVSGEAVTMVWQPIALAEGIQLEDLDITWYCEGVEVASGSSTFVSTPAAGTHRYDVIINHPTLGSMGSTSLLCTMPLTLKGGE